MKKFLFLFAISSVALFGCDKDDDDDNKQSERTTFLVQQTWKFESAGFDMGSNGSIDLDLTSQTPTCLSDNTLTFSVNGNGTMDEGATKCNAAAPQSTAFTWNFTNNETEMNINGNVIPGVNSGKFKIMTLTNTQFTLSKDTVVQGIPGAAVVSLKH